MAATMNTRNCLLRCGLILGLALSLVTAPTTPAADTDSLLASWLAAQTNIHGWSADFIQTRTFKSLAQPLVSTGHVWFAEPNRFHWELGKPPQTIAVKAATALLVIYPRLKRVERYPVTGAEAGQWREALALLEAGFPRSEAELTARFKILSKTVQGDSCEVALEPRSPSARKMMPEFKVAFKVSDLSLLATELQFAGGSTIRNQFTNAVLNPKIDPELFDPKIGPEYKITEPLKAGP
jgi:outer membrane lipoprotein-sorting protein